MVKTKSKLNLATDAATLKVMYWEKKDKKKFPIGTISLIRKDLMRLSTKKDLKEDIRGYTNSLVRLRRKVK